MMMMAMSGIWEKRSREKGADKNVGRARFYYLTQVVGCGQKNAREGNNMSTE